MTRSLKELRTGSAVLCVMSLLTTIAVVPIVHAQNTGGVGFYRANPGRTGYVAGTLGTPLSIIWQNTTAPSADNTSAPVDDNGTLFYATGGTLYAVDEEDGDIKWQYPPSDADGGPDTRKAGLFHCPPCVADGKVFIGNDDGYLYAIDEQTGEDVFQIHTDGPIRSAPVVDNGVVYFGSVDGHLYDIRESDHQAPWGGRFKTAGPVLGPIIVSNDQVIFTDTNNAVYDTVKNTGRLLWSYNAQDGVVDYAPLITGSTVVIASDKHLIGLSSHNGQQIWNATLPTVVMNQPASNADGTLFYAATSDFYLNAVNPRGAISWRAHLDSPTVAGPSVMGNTIIVTLKSGAVYGFDATTGATLWSYSLNAIVPPSGYTQNAKGYVSTSALISNGKVFILANNSTLTAFATNAVDQIAPVATLQYPDEDHAFPGAQIPYSIMLKDEGTGIDPKSIVLKVDGKIIPTDYSVGNQQITVKTVTAGQLFGSTVVRLATLITGKHVLTLTASDWRGNKLDKTWRFSTDNALNLPTSSLPPNNAGVYATQSGTDSEFTTPGGGASSSGGSSGGGSAGGSSGGSGGGSGGSGGSGSSGGSSGNGGSNGGGGTPPPPNAPPPTAPPGTGGGFPPPPPI